LIFGLSLACARSLLSRLFYRFAGWKSLFLAIILSIAQEASSKKKLTAEKFSVQQLLIDCCIATE